MLGLFVTGFLMIIAQLCIVCSIVNLIVSIAALHIVEKKRDGRKVKGKKVIYTFAILFPFWLFVFNLNVWYYTFKYIDCTLRGTTIISAIFFCLSFLLPIFALVLYLQKKNRNTDDPTLLDDLCDE